MSESLSCFQLVAGQYIGADYTQAKQLLEFSDGKPKLDRKGNQIVGHPSRKFNIGEVVVAPVDLVQQHGRKFVYKGPYTGPGAATSQNVAPPSTGKPKVGYTESELNAFGLDELRALAAEEEIDVADAKTKAQVVKAILAARS